MFTSLTLFSKSEFSRIVSDTFISTADEHGGQVLESFANALIFLWKGWEKQAQPENKTNQPEYDISFVEIFIKSQYTPSEYS